MRYQGNLFAERCRDHGQLLCGEQLTSDQLVGHSNASTAIDNPPDYRHPFLAAPSGTVSAPSVSGRPVTDVTCSWWHAAVVTVALAGHIGDTRDRKAGAQ